MNRQYNYLCINDFGAGVVNFFKYLIDSKVSIRHINRVKSIITPLLWISPNKQNYTTVHRLWMEHIIATRDLEEDTIACYKSSGLVAPELYDLSKQYLHMMGVDKMLAHQIYHMEIVLEAAKTPLEMLRLCPFAHMDVCRLVTHPTWNYESQEACVKLIRSMTNQCFSENQGWNIVATILKRWPKLNISLAGCHSKSLKGILLLKERYLSNVDMTGLDLGQFPLQSLEPVVNDGRYRQYLV